MNGKETLVESPHLSHQPKLYRYFVVTLVVTSYVALGFLLHPDANAYLLLGMPITVLFQMLVAQRPLSELWLRHGQTLQFDRRTLAWLILFLIGLIQATVAGIHEGSWQITIHGLMAILGATGAAFAFRVLGRKNMEQIGVLLLLVIPIVLVR